MFLTEERAQNLVDYLGADADRAEKLSKMSAEDAAAAINAYGYDFTVDELKEFSEVVEKVTVAKDNAVSADGLLNEEAL